MLQFYGSGRFGPICELAVEVFQKQISAIAQQGKRVIKVLEVGAGMILQFPPPLPVSTIWLTCLTQELDF
jgi:hypothetical protein